jgi:hypothetical protein
MLLASLFLSISGFIILPIFGPLIGGFLAFFGKRRVARNPLLIGPRFANVALLIAVGSMVGSGYLVATRILPGFYMQQAYGEKLNAVVEPLRTRKYEEAYQGMSVAWREEHTLEDMKAMILAAFPGEADIPIDEESVEERREGAQEELGKRMQEFLKTDTPSEIRFLIEVRLTPPEGNPADMDIGVYVRRSGLLDFESEITSLRIAPAEPEESDAAEEAGSGEDPAANEAESEPEEEPR